MYLRHYSVQSPFKRVPPSTIILHRFLSSNPNDDVQRVLDIITSTSTPEHLKQSLKSSGAFLSNDLIDQVLKRVRFSHANPSQTLEFFRYTARRKGFYHPPFSLDTMLYILGRTRMFSHVLDLLIEAREKVQSLITPRTVMVVLGRIASVCSDRQTVESFRRFKKTVPDFDTNCFNALLRTLCQEKSMTDARNAYHSLKHGFRPNLQTFNILLSGWKTPEDAEDKAKDVLKEMKEYGCYPNVAAYNAAVRNFCIAKRLRDAYGLMDEMRCKGLSPNATTYNLFFRVFYWSNDLQSSWNLYRRMMVEGCLPNTQSCMFLIRLFRKHEKVDMALQLWGDMVEKGFGSYTLVSDVLFDLFCDMGKLREAEKCFLEMIEKGQKPSNVSFKRIKVLMELANRHEALQSLTQKMAVFGKPLPSS
ncbi:hypothetical protein RJT34_23173 [Clitoria ternatea]|uniref:Pentatricopeptide repeat-containing protein n=1 Tax=Clitoria ternatea TaxID=43366 RepID=A0AAN9FU45_CLITE